MKKIILGLFAAVCSIILIIYVAGYIFFSGKFLPGTVICDIDMSLKTAEEAKELLDNKMNNFSMRVTNGNIEDYVSGEDVGLTYTISQEVESLQTIIDEQDKMRWFLEHSAEFDSDVTIDSAKLKATAKKTNCISSDEIVAPEDAYIDYQEGRYFIVEEVQGNKLNTKKFIKQLKKHFLALDSSYDAKCYLSPEILSTSETLTEQIDAYNKVIDNVITIENQYRSLTLSGDELRSMVKLKKGKVKLISSKLEDYVNNTVADTFYSIGATRTMTTLGSGTFTVSGGTYGYIVDKEATLAALKEAILAGEEVTLEPSYYREETYSYNSGLGSTYIDVNIAEQHVWFVYNGEVIVSTDCVTGNVSSNNGTPTGTYWIEYKRTDYQFNEFGNGAIVDCWMCISNITGVGLHDAPWRSEFGGDIYETDGSHGCINLPADAAHAIYDRCFGTLPVVVH